MDKIEVTQADRDAAAAVVQAYRDNKNGNWQARIRNGECDDGYIVQAFARHRLATRTDATPVAVEIVAELQLAAFLAGRGSIHTKVNGRTQKSSLGPTMDDYRRMARQALAPFTKGQNDD